MSEPVSAGQAMSKCPKFSASEFADVGDGGDYEAGEPHPFVLALHRRGLIPNGCYSVRLCDGNAPGREGKDAGRTIYFKPCQHSSEKSFSISPDLFKELKACADLYRKPRPYSLKEAQDYVFDVLHWLFQDDDCVAITETGFAASWRNSPRSGHIGNWCEEATITLTAMPRQQIVPYPQAHKEIAEAEKEKGR